MAVGARDRRSEGCSPPTVADVGEDKGIDDDAKAKHGLTTTTDRDWAAAGRCCMMGRLGKV
jgi:hypothetical protein